MNNDATQQDDIQQKKDAQESADADAQGEQTAAAEAQDQVVEVHVDYKDKWLRAQADYANLVKETSARRGEWAEMSEAYILEEFIPVYDNFCKAFAHELKSAEKDVENWKKGIAYIMQQFWTVLKNHNIEKIETVGKQFNPAFHESVGEEKKDGANDHDIVREVEGGYMLKGKVLKVAKVIVSIS